MGERQTKMVAYRVDYTCEVCGGPLNFLGITLTSYPPQYPHKCGDCGQRVNLDQMSGRTIYKPEQPDAD